MGGGPNHFGNRDSGGVGVLFLLLLQLVRGRFTAEEHWGVEATIKYWHFVDVVWMFFYPALYLVG